MPRLKKADKERVDSILRQQNVFKLINDHLKTIGLQDFEVATFKVKLKNKDSECPVGYRKIRVCENGTCWYECEKI